MAIKDVGLLLREARRRKGFSLEKLEEKTRIKKGFIRAIEEERWEKLPEYPVVVGFVKNLASYLEIDRERAVALLRRDYPPGRKGISVKPEKVAEFQWSPRMTFIMAVVGLLLAVLGYLGFQYYRFSTPSELMVGSPVEDQVVNDKVLEVTGKVSRGAVVRVNNQPVVVEEDGIFEVEVEVSESTEKIEVVAISRAGKETVIERKIRVEL